MMRLRPLCSLPVLMLAARPHLDALQAARRAILSKELDAEARRQHAERYEPDPEVVRMLRELDDITQGDRP